jgi:hypothetical protein
MTKNRIWLLVVLALGLGALLWWDNQPGGAPDRPAGKREAGGIDARPRAARPAAAPLASPQPFLPAAGGEAANPLAALDKDSLNEMVERPLFAPSRHRPPPPSVAASEPEPPAAPPPKPAPPSYILLGVVRDGDRAIALLRNRSDGRNFRVEVGDMIGGWQIAAVGPVSVMLKRADGTQHEVQLSR